MEKSEMFPVATSWCVVKFIKSGKIKVMPGKGAYNASIYEVLFMNDDLKACEQMKNELLPEEPKLFNDDQFKVPNDKFCRSCKFREWHEKGDSVIQYCGIRKSNRTQNGLLKIKTNMPACLNYETIKK